MLIYIIDSYPIFLIRGPPGWLHYFKAARNTVTSFESDDPSTGGNGNLRMKGVYKVCYRHQKGTYITFAPDEDHCENQQLQKLKFIENTYLKGKKYIFMTSGTISFLNFEQIRTVWSLFL